MWIPAVVMMCVELAGMVLMHPCFRGTIDDEGRLYMCPTNSGVEDPKLRPTAEGLAENTWQRLKTSPSLVDAAMGRIAQGTKALTESLVIMVGIVAKAVDLRPRVITHLPLPVSFKLIFLQIVLLIIPPIVFLNNVKFPNSWS